MRRDIGDSSQNLTTTDLSACPSAMANTIADAGGSVWTTVSRIPVDYSFGESLRGDRKVMGWWNSADTHHSQRFDSMSSSGYPKFKNDRGVPEICIGVKKFKCIGVSPPQDHPHIYIDMRKADAILCPYCATLFRFDPRLTPLDAAPPDSVFSDQNAA